MALIHAATIRPTKVEVVADLVARSTWGVGPLVPDDVELVGAYRLDDPDGQVGLETQLARCGGPAGVLVQVPLTYRGAPLDGVDAVATMEHSVLGPRWVYDGCDDPAFLRMLAAFTLTGVGQAVELLHHRGRDLTRPAGVRLVGSGRAAPWPDGVLAVDGFGPARDGSGVGHPTVVSSDVLRLTLLRRPLEAEVTPADRVVTAATWRGQDAAVVLATVEVLTPGA